MCRGGRRRRCSRSIPCRSRRCSWGSNSPRLRGGWRNRTRRCGERRVLVRSCLGRARPLSLLLSLFLSSYHAPQMLSQQTVPSLFRMPLAHKSSAGAGGVGGGTKGMPRTAEHTAGASSMQETQKSKQHGRDEPVGNARQDGSQLQVPPPKMPPQNSPPRGVRLQAPDPESGANGFGKVASNVAGSVPQNSTPQEQVLTQPKSALKKSTATSQAPALAVMSAALQLGSAGLPGAPKTASH
mmetsp:Transcript_9049/g.26356  ORF Transcript_9049/g.26356 Transcript_9049/m.26356 type:complete len:240 (+) Transcript_9049:268-987(+)